MSDKINPDHYRLPSGLEAYDVTQHFDFTTGNAIKYLWRAGRKEGEYKLTDLKKAQWYLNQLIEKEELNALQQETDPPSSLHCNRTGISGDYLCDYDRKHWENLA